MLYFYAKNCVINCVGREKKIFFTFHQKKNVHKKLVVHKKNVHQNDHSFLLFNFIIRPLHAICTTNVS